MCGRYTITIDKSTIEHRFGGRVYVAQAEYEPTFNAAPSQMLPIMRTHGANRIELARWGFWPEEWRHNKRARPQINARLETAAEKPMFGSAFRGRHCIVIADGYYEWRTVGAKKQPYRIVLKSGEPFAMAGLYAREPDGFETAETRPVNFAILTTKANDAVRHIHDRMPVILPLGREKHWLATGGTFYFLPFPAELMTAYPVTHKVNRVSFNEREAIAPIEPTIQLSL